MTSRLDEIKARLANSVCGTADIRNGDIAWLIGELERLKTQSEQKGLINLKLVENNLALKELLARSPGFG